jgi:phosphoglycerate dehydrogenase-like enzyme
MLFFAKKVKSFLEKKSAHKWEKDNVEMVGDKTMLIVGYGDIGMACAKVAKFGYGTKIVGLKRRPELASPEARSYADVIVGLDQLDKWLPKADYVVGILPGSTDNNDFFNNNNIFCKMKPSAIFMNIGRGTCVNEEDLVFALHTKAIAGAVLDVYKVEPLVRSSDLWKQKNVLLYPHCADLDNDYFRRCWPYFEENVEHFMNSRPLTNLVDKYLGY